MTPPQLSIEPTTGGGSTLSEHCESAHAKLSLRALVAACSAAVLVVATCWGLVERGVARAQDAGEVAGAALAAHETAAANTHSVMRAELAAQTQATQRTELRAQRSEVMLEMLLRDVGMKPPPPVKVDGGSP